MVEIVEVLQEFLTKNGRKVILRTPTRKDIDGLLGLFSSLFDQGTEGIEKQEFSIEKELEWLTAHLSLMEKGMSFFILAEVGGEIMARCQFSLQKSWQFNLLSGMIDSANRSVIFRTFAGKTSKFNLIQRNIPYLQNAGVVGIIIKRGFRNIGIGTAMMHILIEQAERMGLDALTLTVSPTNNRAIHIYEKVGFKRTVFHLERKKITMIKHLKKGAVARNS